VSILNHLATHYHFKLLVAPSQREQQVATGLQQVKELHDDGNAAIIPEIWTSLIGDETVVIRFCGCGFNMFFTCSANRFAWFYGWVLPHKTEVPANLSSHAVGKMKGGARLHHSPFSKPEVEHFALVLCSPKYIKEVLQSYHC
jgi:hypothetical protein